MTTDEAPTSATDQRADIPGVVMPPPALFAVAFAIAFCLNYVHPLRIPLAPRLAYWPTVVFLNSSWVVALWATGFMIRAGTRINPLRPSTALVRGGPYRYSRNPLSISLVLLYIGLAFQLNTLWPVILLPPLLWVNHFGIILREERYLEAKFGDEYRNYRAAVRRWI
jgi:protein-S-isoprenylcysteine O-methyltransferase Ste14